MTNEIFTGQHMSDDIGEYDNPLDYLSEKYKIDSEDGSDFVEFRPEGVDEIEFIIKMEIAAIRAGSGDIDTKYELETLTLARIYIDILDQVEKRELFREKMSEERGSLPNEGHEAVDTVFRVEVADSVLLYYTLANEIIRGMAAELLREQAFESRNENTDFLRNVNQSTLANFLYHTGLAKKKLKDEMINANQTRNKLVHEFTSRHYLDGISDVLPMINRLNYTINELYDLLYGGRPLTE